jgi:hypothetical protein
MKPAALGAAGRAVGGDAATASGDQAGVETALKDAGVDMTIEADRHRGSGAGVAGLRHA